MFYLMFNPFDAEYISKLMTSGTH